MSLQYSETSVSMPVEEGICTHNLDMKAWGDEGYEYGKIPCGFRERRLHTVWGSGKSSLLKWHLRWVLMNWLAFNGWRFWRKAWTMVICNVKLVHLSQPEQVVHFADIWDRREEQRGRSPGQAWGHLGKELEGLYFPFSKEWEPLTFLEW